MDQRTALIFLADMLASHQGVTHFAISYRALGKGDFFRKLKEGGDCRTATVAKVLTFFSTSWPSDLDWPADIPRPAPDAKAAAPRKQRKAA